MFTTIQIKTAVIVNECPKKENDINYKKNLKVILSLDGANIQPNMIYTTIYITHNQHI